MAKGMTKGHTGNDNKPKLSVKEKRLKKKQKSQAKIVLPA